MQIVRGSEGFFLGFKDFVRTASVRNLDPERNFILDVSFWPQTIFTILQESTSDPKSQHVLVFGLYITFAHSLLVFIFTLRLW